MAMAYNPVADLGLSVRDAPPGPKILHFHTVFGKNWPNNRLTPPPLGNPGSATAITRGTVMQTTFY